MWTHRLRHLPWSALVHSGLFWPALASGLTWPVPVTVDDTLHKGKIVNHTIPMGKYTNHIVHEGKRPQRALGQDRLETG